MNANPILLQKKYARVVELFAKENAITVAKAMVKDNKNIIKSQFLFYNTQPQ